MKPFLRAAAPLAVLTFASCVIVGGDYEPPAAAAPESFRESGGPLTAEPADIAAWWRHFEDPVLDGLVARATAQSLEIKEALARVAESRALRGVAESGLYPTIDATGNYRRISESENTPFGSFAIDWDRYEVGFDAAWEIDLWGQVRRSIEAADADMQADIENARAVLVTVAAETAASYMDLRALQERVAIARNNLTNQRQTEALVSARFDSGLVGERDVAQAKSIVAAQQSRIPSLEAQLRAAENRLAVLLGRTPGTLAEELAEVRPIPTPPTTVAVGVPADIVRRRPDVRAAERALAAATARIGVAEGDLYPQLTIFGNVGTVADDASELFEASSSVLSVGPSIRWNLFDGGRVRRTIAAQDARAQQALARWEQLVLIALEEAENAMAAFVREQQRAEHLAEAAGQARRAVDFARTQYTEGLTDFQTVLDSERATSNLEDELAQSRAAIGTNLIALYKALGGGWESESE